MKKKKRSGKKKKKFMMQKLKYGKKDVENID